MKVSPIPAHKFTVSLPGALYEAGECERERLGISRSEFVANLYRSYLRDTERQHRIDRYRQAYQLLPPGPDEDALTTESMELLASEPV